MKIEDALNRIINFKNVELSRKTAVISPEKTPRVDSYDMSEELGRVEQEVFQVLKDVTRDLMSSVNANEGNNKDIITKGNTGIDPLGLAGLPLPKSDILVLLITGKTETPDNPLKIIIAYKTDEPVTGSFVYQEMARNGFIDAIAETAKKYTGISPGSVIISTKEDKGNIASQEETGYVVRIPYFSHLSFEEQALRSITGQGGEKGSPWQSLMPVAPDAVHVVSIESAGKKGAGEEGANNIAETGIAGKVIDGQKLLTLNRIAGNHNEFFEKLSIFANDMEKIVAQEVAQSPFRVEPPNVVVIRIDPAEDNDTMIPLSPDRFITGIPQNRAEKITENVKDDITSEAISLTTSGGQEIKQDPVTKGPVMSTAELPADNDPVLKRLTLFVDRVNALLDEDAVVDEIPIDAPAGREPDLLSDKLQLLRLQTKDAGTGLVVQAAVKKIIFENEEFQKAQAIGLSIGKNNLLHLDIATLEGSLISNREEALNTLKGLGSSLYERINYFVHPYAGIYADNKEILQLRATQKDEGTSLLDKELNKEQGGLEKRLNELQLLIERSTLLKQWFTEDHSIPGKDNI